MAFVRVCALEDSFQLFICSSVHLFICSSIHLLINSILPLIGAGAITARRSECQTNSHDIWRNQLVDVDVSDPQVRQGVQSLREGVNITDTDVLVPTPSNTTAHRSLVFV